MAESGDLYIWDVSSQYHSFDHPGTVIAPAAKKPQATLSMHGRTEGYALDWSPHPKDNMGKIASGDNEGRIFISTCKEGGSWATSKDPLRGHTGSVEELQWSPGERHVFASASSDGTVKIWDARAPNRKHQLSVEVSSSDVNVASWCRSVDYLLATGADDGVWGVWDLRTFPSTAQGKTISATASFTFHQEPITSVEFHPSEDSVVAVACADNTVTQWDLGVELDDEESKDTGGVVDVPPQLMFVHHMPEVKEVHWQQQAPSVVVATGGEGFKYVSSSIADEGERLISTTVCSRPSVHKWAKGREYERTVKSLFNTVYIMLPPLSNADGMNLDSSVAIDSYPDYNYTRFGSDVSQNGHSYMSCTSPIRSSATYCLVFPTTLK